MDKRPDIIIDVQSILPSVVLDIRYNTKNNFIGEPIDGYLTPKALLSKPACLALKQVQRGLVSFGLGLKIFDAYRPQISVDHFVRWSLNQDNKMKSIYYPDINKADLFKQGFIAQQSSHSRASTLDVTLVSLSSGSFLELNMGTSWDFFGEASWTHHTAIIPEQRANRMLLQNVMRQAGFSGLKQEWWHFTLNNEPFTQTYFNFPVE